jgi:hypothetical protein
MLGPFQFLLVAIAGWMNQRQLPVIEYLREENRVLREQLGEHRLRFNDDQRLRLSVRAKACAASSWLKLPLWLPPILYWLGTAN